MKLEADLTKEVGDKPGLILKNSNFDELVTNDTLFEEEKNLRIG
jgi:hypothetical protein